MSSRIWIGVCGLALAGAFLFGGAFAQDMGMPEWMKPTKEHEAMQALAGEWDLDMSMWMAPGAPPMKTAATAVTKPILGGKYMEETVKANMMGMPFEGRSTMGYDTVRKQWVTTWMDNMTPVMSVYYGTEKDGVVTSFGEDPDHATGKLKKTKIVVTHKDKDHFTMAMFDVGPKGDNKTMEIAYSRKGADGCGCDDGCGCGCDEGCGCDGCGCGCD